MTILTKEAISFTREEADALIMAKFIFMNIYSACEAEATEEAAERVIDAIDNFYENVTVLGI